MQQPQRSRTGTTTGKLQVLAENSALFANYPINESSHRRYHYYLCAFYPDTVCSMSFNVITHKHSPKEENQGKPNTKNEETGAQSPTPFCTNLVLPT